MKPIDEMTPEEKSNLLCNLCGWQIVEFMQYYDYRLMDANDNEIASFPDWYQTDGDMPNLYNPANMALAWRVLNFAITYDWPGHVRGYPNDGQILEWNLTETELMRMSPSDAQRLWLDKILSLAIEAGLCEDTAVS